MKQYTTKEFITIKNKQKVYVYERVYHDLKINKRCMYICLYVHINVVQSEMLTHDVGMSLDDVEMLLDEGVTACTMLLARLRIASPSLIYDETAFDR